MTSVKIQLQLLKKFKQFASHNGRTFDIPSEDIEMTWDDLFSALATFDKTMEFKACDLSDLVVKKSVSRYSRQHRLSEKIQEFINTFGKKQDVYKVYLRKFSLYYDSSPSPQGLRDPEVPKKPKIPGPFDYNFTFTQYINLSLPPRSPAMSMSYGWGTAGVLKRFSDLDHDDKPAKSPRLCKSLLGTSADIDDSESSASSDPSTYAHDFSHFLILSLSASPPAFSYGSGILKRVSEHAHNNDKPLKSFRACEAVLGTSADSLEKVEVDPVDGIESNVSSDLSKDSKENELVQSLQDETGSWNAEDFNPNLDGADGPKDQEEIRGEIEEVQHESSVVGGVLGDNDRGNYYEDPDGNQYGYIQDVETTNEEDVNDDKNPQINSVISLENEAETRIQNLNEIGTIMEEIDVVENEKSMDLNEMQKDEKILDEIGVVRADGQLNLENSIEISGENDETKDQEVRGEHEEVQDESSVAGGVLGENVRGNLVQGVGAGGNGGNMQDVGSKHDKVVVEVAKDDKNQIIGVISQREETKTQIQNMHDTENVVLIKDDENENSMNLNEIQMDETIFGEVEGADGQLNENSGRADKEDNQPVAQVEQIIPENPIIKQKDENDDVEIISIVFKRDGRSSVKTEVEVTNLDGQEEKCENKGDARPSRKKKRKVPNSVEKKCERRADVILKTENIPKEQKVKGEGETEGKSKCLRELKNLSNDDFRSFQEEIKQLESTKGDSRANLRKAPRILLFLQQFATRSQNLQEFADKVQNELSNSRFQGISEEITQLSVEMVLENIFNPLLTTFLWDFFC